MSYKISYEGEPGTTHVVTLKPRSTTTDPDILLLRPGESVTLDKLPDALKKDAGIVIEGEGAKALADTPKRRKRS